MKSCEVAAPESCVNFLGKTGPIAVYQRGNNPIDQAHVDGDVLKGCCLEEPLDCKGSDRECHSQDNLKLGAVKPGTG